MNNVSLIDLRQCLGLVVPFEVDTILVRLFKYRLGSPRWAEVALVFVHRLSPALVIVVVLALNRPQSHERRFMDMRVIQLKYKVNL
ncbi:hypothetical protein L596_029159 [Steinernema carpocapsae]|uniref:Uncharacterized protein n=1 Tax=Steinernema carpocapsae TaxID=34508 RepID=A0A4U5LTT6_STECR|nr:hypothetical protein L596_029159 [Steinernema carpocapsae]